MGLPELESAKTALDSDAPIDEKARKAFAVKMVYKNPIIWGLAFANFFVYVVRFSVLDWGPKFLTEACGMSYHLKYIPTKDNKTCDKCGAKLIIRKDDQPETVLERLKIYHDQTEPLKAYYGAKGILKSVDGRGDIAEITELILKSIQA